MNYSHWSSLRTFLVVSFHIFLEGKPHLLHTFCMDRLTKARALSAKCLCLLSALAWNSKNIISYRGRMGTKTRPTCSVQEKRTRFWKTAAFEKPPRGQIQAFKKNPRRSGKCQVFEWLFLVQVICQMNRPNVDNVVSMWSFLTYGSCIEFPW